MAAIKQLTGFITGLVFGGAALVALAIYVPQVNVPAKQPDAKPTVEQPKTVAPKVEAAKIVKPEVIAPALPAARVAEAKVAEAKLPEPSVMQPAPKIVLNSEKPEKPKKPKLFDLPTITPDTAIPIVKKPPSTLPSISTRVAYPAIAGTALELYATQFDAPDRPLLGVILLDIGDKGLRVDQLKSLNAPLTIAIRSDAPNASERALSYEAAGFEVIAMVPDANNAPLANALTTKAVEDAIDVMFTTVPNAIGLLDSTNQRIQKNGRIAKAVINAFVGTGHGLVTYAKGLNSVDREARASGVRTAKVDRKLDANRENKAMMLRYLDRAALDAGRDGAAIVLGTTAKATVAALAGWLLSSKGRTVAVAPASAVLLGK